MTPRNHLVAPLRAAAFFILAICMLASALAFSVTAPASIREGDVLVVSLSGAGTLSIARDGVTIASGTGSITNSLATNSSSAGIVHYLFSDGTTNESRDIEIIDVPLSLNITSPVNDISTSSVTFALTTNWAPEFCYVNIDGVGHTLDNATPTVFSGTFTVADGVHTIDYKCKLGSELATATKTIHVDTIAPIITSSSPTGEVTGPYVTLSVDTNEIALCRYGTDDVDYGSMPNAMSTTYALRNTATISTMSYGSYTYFVRCQDVSGNAMANSTIISFLSKVPPIASISIDGKEPLKAGTYDVTVKTNVPLAAAPTLTYALQQSGKSGTVALEGNGDVWHGFVAIPDDIPDTVIAFSFSGTSIQGISGNQVAEGSIFTVSASVPSPIDTISIENTSSQLKIKWFSKNGAVSYNIYRADHEGVQYTDYYASASSMEFTDTHATGARYYYYRVAAVDAAGNIGPLSAEVYGSVIDSNLAVQIIDPLLAAKLDEEIVNINALLLDANTTLANLQSESNPVSIEVISDMHLVDDAHRAVGKLEAAASLLKDLRSRAPNGDEVNAAIAQERDAISASRSLLITKVIPKEQTDTTQSSDALGMEKNMPYALIGENLTTDQQTKYAQSATDLQDHMTVALSALVFTLYDNAGASHDYTFVRKRITLESPVNDVSIIEIIPKSVAQHASDIVFSTQPTILQDDPVVSYAKSILDQDEYTYVIKSAVSLDHIKETRTFVYPKPPQQVEQTNTATGNAVKSFTLPSSDTWLIIVGAVIIIALSGYYVSLSKEEKPFKGITGVRMRRPVPIQHPVHQIVTQPAQQIVTQPLDVPTVDVRELLHEASMLIDDKEYDRALDLYQRASAILKNDEGLQQIVHEETSILYMKLVLFKRMTEARVAAEKKDHVGLARALEDVKSLAARIGDQPTQLITEAKASYAAFVRALNTLEIEKMGKY